MKENDVVALAALLGKSQEDVSTAIENGGISDFIKDFSDGHKIMSVSDFDKREANLRQSVADEIAVAESVPKPIYDRVKGTVLEMVEKDLAKKYEISEYNGFDDLVGKLVTKTKNPTETESELKARITELIEKHDQEKSDLMQQNDLRYSDLLVSNAVNSLPIDADGDKLNVQRDIIKTMFSSNHKFEVKGNDVVVLKKDGDGWSPVQDSKLDPIPLSDVLSDYAKGIVNLKSPGSGGRGDKSSTSGSKTVSAKKYMKDHGINEHSFAWAEAYKKFQAEGYEITE